MSKAIAMVELNSIARGIEVSDDMVKAARVELLRASTVCPGKYMVIVGGDTGAVKASLKAGIAKGAEYVVDQLMIPSVHEQLFPAIEGVQEVKKVEGATSLPKKVMPILVEAKQNGIQPNFVQYLMGNLQHLGTLPDHVLHDIIKAKKKGWTALDSYLSSLKDGMGNDYASLLLPGEDDDVVIVAIDKQVDG